jgi:dolichyl-phosphate beta-glucosyltransferase
MSVGIVVPCFNEAARWSPDYWTAMFGLGEVRWIFVDDGSSDGTGELLDRLTASFAVEVIHLSRNRGKAEAVRQGMIMTLDTSPELEAVGYMDADGAFSVDDVRVMVSAFRDRCRMNSREKTNSFDAVWSSRVALAGRDIRRSMTRHYIGRAVATAVSIGQPQMPYDTQSGLKLFAPTPALSVCLDAEFRTRWLFELELLARWTAGAGAPMRVWEVPLNYWHDVPGSKIRGTEVVRVLRELAIVKSVQRACNRSARGGSRRLRDTAHVSSSSPRDC